MRRLYPAILLLFVPFMLSAQNWKTVSDKDTVYFRAGKHNGFPYSFDSSYLRVLWVTSSTAIGSDSSFSFFPTMRDTTHQAGACLDTMAGCWAGARFIRKPNGIEYYFNAKGDTITIKTGALLGDSWTLVNGANGIVYKGTVTDAGITNVDNSADSFKVVSIQAYSNNNPVSSLYNSLVLQFSKEHGWLKTLDMYAFPDYGHYDWMFDQVLSSQDTTQHIRLSKAFAEADMNFVDLPWKYQAGNEWIIYNESGIAPTIGANKVIVHDSITSMTMLTANTVQVSFKTEQYVINWHFVQGPPYDHWVDSSGTSVWYHTDTFGYSGAPALVKYNLYPEYKSRALSPANPWDNSHIVTNYFVDTFCSKSYFIKFHQLDAFGIDTMGNCWTFLPPISGYGSTDNTILTGFGNVYHHWEESGDALCCPDFYTRTYYSYLKLDNCEWGTKVNVLTLNINDKRAQGSLSVYPNPANDRVFIKSCSTSVQTTVTLSDIMGRTLTRLTGSTATMELSLKGYRPGMYILSVRTGASMFTCRLQVE